MMESIQGFFDILMDSEKLIAYGGLTLLLIIIFAETGLFFGFIFPGDPLLFTAGLLCGTQDLTINIYLLLFSVTLAAIVGNMVGYASGKILSKTILNKTDTFFFKRKHLQTAHDYYDQHGGKSLIAARFLPIVRTFAPIVAGTIHMNFWKFKFYNITGAFLWVWTLVPLGYFLGNRYPQLIHQLEYFIVGIMLISTAIFIRGYFKLKNKKKLKKKNEQ